MIIIINNNQSSPPWRDFSPAAPESRTTLAQRATSLSTNWPKSAPVMPGMAEPLLVQISLILGVFRALVISAVMRSTASLGVPAGAQIAYQVDTT